MRAGAATAWPDLITGLSLAGLVLPEAVAYAGIAGVPPLSGLLAAMAGLVSYALLGSSRYAIVAATSSSAAVLAAALHSLSGVPDGHALALSAAMVLMTGVLFLVCSALRLGRMAQFIARPVVRGFALGLAVVITARQLVKACGIHTASTALGPMLVEFARRHAEWQLPSLLLAAAALLLLALLHRWPRLPATLLVIVLGIVAVPLMGAAGSGLALVGTIHLAGVHPQLPALSADEWFRASELAVALMLILFAESYSSVRACALRHGDAVNVNRELLALGVANVAAAIFQGLPVGAGYSGTSANESLGARSRLAGFAAAVCIGAALLLLRPWVARIPEAVLAAIVIYAMRDAASLEPLRPYLIWKRDRVIVVAAIVAVLALGVLDGLLVAIGVSLALLIRDLTQPRVSELGRLNDSHDFVSVALHPSVKVLPDILILRPDEPLFFANAEPILDHATARLAAAPGTRALVLSLEESPDLDGTAIEVLGQFAAQVIRTGCQLRLARLKDPVIAVLNTAALPGLTGEALSGASVDAVVQALLP
jgi:MFS superfamily sulfate permease-like transporter